ncbi:MAG: hypothetical protein ABWK01_08190 [Infirmifilum sp.]
MIKVYVEKNLTAEELIRMSKNRESLLKAYLAYEEEGEEVETYTRVELPVKVARKILSKRNIELLEVLSEKKVSSISNLANILHRSTSNVYRDLEFLRRYGLVSFIERGRQKIPILLVRKILIEIR